MPELPHADVPARPRAVLYGEIFKSQKRHLGHFHNSDHLWDLLDDVLANYAEYGEQASRSESHVILRRSLPASVGEIHVFYRINPINDVVEVGHLEVRPRTIDNDH